MMYSFSAVALWALPGSALQVDSAVHRLRLRNNSDEQLTHNETNNETLLRDLRNNSDERLIHNEKNNETMKTPLVDWMNEEKNSGYAGRPDRSNFLSNLQSAIDKGHAEGCNAEIIYRWWDNGFGSKLQQFANFVAMAAYSGKSFAIAADVESGHAHVPFDSEVWLKYFEDPLNIPRCHGVRGDSWDDHAFVVNLQTALYDWYPHMQDTVTDSGDDRYAIDLMKFVFSNIFQLKDFANQAVEHKLWSLGVPAGTRYVGVQIRHGDHYKEAPSVATSEYGDTIEKTEDALEETAADDLVQAQRFINVTNALLEDIRSATAESRRHHSHHKHHYEACDVGDIRTVFVATDDTEAPAALQTMLGDGFSVVAQPPPGRNDENPDQDEFIGLLTDLVGLRDSTMYYAAESSNFARVAYYLRPEDGDLCSRSMDRPWGPQSISAKHKHHHGHHHR